MNDPQQTIRCPKCKGLGKVRVASYSTIDEYRTCKRCNGRGWILPSWWSRLLGRR